jgi:hypothetical protein
MLVKNTEDLILIFGLLLIVAREFTKDVETDLYGKQKLVM